MCKYCCPSECDEFDTISFHERHGGFAIGIGIFDDSMEVSLSYKLTDIVSFEKKINYCPMCGRKL